MSIEIKIDCNDCGSTLDANIDNNTIYVDVCTKCSDELSGKSFDEGYEERKLEEETDAESK